MSTALVEYRIPMPLAVDEFFRGQLYMIAEKALELSGGEEGIEVISNYEYDNRDGHWGVSPISGIPVPLTKGQYTLKRYHLRSKVPSIGK
jgi:hypothetical protein